ncbi:SPOR domain-containing protein [Bacillus sp. SCS-153A]|uniref:SPOR domain-containing protein n=1 Tax=Rossellomorea sedimentorum TaxID=3115294 RepID=UPI003906ADC7
MDKRGNKDGKITIKINGDKKNYNEELLVHNWKLGEEESAAAEESAEDDSFDWVLPDEDPAPKEFKKINYVQKKKGKKHFTGRQITPGIARMIYTLVGAVAISLIFGFIILNVITDGEQSIPAVQLQEAADASDADKETATASGGAITLESLSASVLQGGFFSTSDSANAMKAALEAKGIPTAVIEMEASYYLFVGTAGDLEGAKAMGKKLSGENIEVYAKDIVLPEKNIEGTKTDADFIKKSQSVYAAVAAESSNAYTNGTINGEKMIEISVLLKDLSAQKVSENMAGLKASLEAAATSLKEYQSSSDLTKLIDSQQFLLSYLESYQKL